MRGLIAFFPQNLTSAVMAVVMALLVWIGATSLELDRVTFPTAAQAQGIPIQLKNKPEGLIVLEGEEQFVRVDLSILRDEMNRLTVSDFVAEADLSGLGPGEHQIPVTIRPQPYAPPSRLLGPIPDRIIVELDEVMTRTIPIEAELLDRSSLPQTYRVLNFGTDPAAITISGPRSIIEPIEKVVAQARIEGARETVVRSVRPQLVGLATADNRWVTTNVEQVSVEIEIGLRPGYRDLIVRVDVQGEPAPGYWVSSITPEPALMTVVGQPEVISALNGIVATEPIDVSGLSEGTFSRATRLQLPEGVSPLNEGIVDVGITIEPQTSSKRVSVSPTVSGLQPGLVVSDIGIIPSEVTVLLKGPITELENLDLEEVLVTLDVTERGLGTHLITPIIQPPGTLVAESLNPELVEVTITEEAINRQIEVPVRAGGQRSTQVVVIEPPMSTVVVNGPVSLVGNVEPPTVTASVEVGTLVNGQYVLTPTITVANGITATSASPVTVTILSGTQILNLTEQVQLLNLDPTLRATLVQSTLTVRIAPRDGTQRLPDIGDLEVSVDLTGRGVGTIRIKPTVRISEDFILVGVVPEEIEINIQTKP
jgi:YbbR domain-containing protein